MAQESLRGGQRGGHLRESLKGAVQIESVVKEGVSALHLRGRRSNDMQDGHPFGKGTSDAAWR